MANAFDDLLGNLVKRLRGVGVGSGTAAENRAKIDYMTASNRAAQAGQATPSEYPYYYGSGADPATAYSNNVGTLNRQAPTGMGGYNQGGMFKFAEQQSVNDTIAGAVPESLSPWRENQLRIEERIRQEEEAARPKNRGLGTSTEEAGYEANLEKARRERAKLLEGNISLDRQENEERRMLSQAETEQARRGLFDYGGMDMPYQGQGESTIELDSSIVTVDDNPTDEQIVKTLEEDYANLAASGADSATLSELAREIDSYRDKKVSLPSIVSEAAASDVVELNGAKVVGNQWSPTPPTTFSSVKGYAGKEAIEQVEATYGPLNDLQKFLVEKEGYYPGWYKDTVGVATVGVGQTGKYAAMTPIEAMNAKIKEVKVKVPVFKDLSLIEQKALIDAHYRGDINNGWKNKYVTYIKARTNDPKSNTLNSLKQKSYDELWNNESYIKMMGRLQANKSKDGDKGVMTRVRKWMKDLFQDDQAPAAIQARIDKYAKTL